MHGQQNVKKMFYRVLRVSVFTKT